MVLLVTLPDENEIITNNFNTLLDDICSRALAVTAKGANVLHIVAGNPTSTIAKKAIQTIAKVAPIGVDLYLPRGSFCIENEFYSIVHAPPTLAEFALKLALNAATVGAYVRRGYIVQNRMVAVAVTNAKLYHRAVGIIASAAQVDGKIAERWLQRAIYGDNALETNYQQRTVAEHVRAASCQRGRVPVAIVLSAAERYGCILNVQEAESLLQKNPVVRKVLAEIQETTVKK